MRISRLLVFAALAFAALAKATPIQVVAPADVEWRLSNVASNGVRLLIPMGDERDELGAGVPLHTRSRHAVVRAHAFARPQTFFVATSTVAIPCEPQDDAPPFARDILLFARRLNI